MRCSGSSARPTTRDAASTPSTSSSIRSTLALPHLSGAAPAAAQPAEPRHHQAVRGPARSDSFLMKTNCARCSSASPPHAVYAIRRMSWPDPIIALLTDFGTRDHYAGTMKGVVLGVCPDVDAGRHHPRHSGARRASPARCELAACYRYFPAGTIFLVVVDPGVGSSRRGIAAEAGDYRFVGARQRRALRGVSTTRRRSGSSS